MTDWERTIEVEVKESAKTTVLINAFDEAEAVSKVAQMYNNNEISLDDQREIDVHIRSLGICQKVILFRSRNGDRPTIRMVI